MMFISKLLTFLSLAALNSFVVFGWYDCPVPSPAYYFQCPSSCNSYPCSSNEDPCCRYDQHKEYGCNQCQDGYFKKSYNHPCVHCQGTFGDGCMFCQDFNGCGQCQSNCQKIYDNYCGLYKCSCPPTPKPTWYTSPPTPKPTWYTSPPTVRPTPKPTWYTSPPTPRPTWYTSPPTPRPTWYPTPKPTPERCDECLAIAIDQSGSINEVEFAQEQVFAKTIIELFSDDADIAIIGFESVATIEFPLGDPSGASAKIDELVVTDGGTNFIDAIDKGINALSECEANKPKVFLIISDGMPNNSPCDPDDLGIDLLNADITTLIAGVGDFDENNQDITCLSDLIFTADSFDDDDLSDLLEDLQENICITPTPEPTKKPTKPDHCPKPCNYWGKPCSCIELEFCKVCRYPEGCDQCDDGYFKVDYDHPCISCKDTFGYGCKFCQDFNGCGQCEDYCQRVFDVECELWKCDCPSRW